MLKRAFLRIPGPPAVRVAVAVVVAFALFSVVIWSYEVLGDLLDSGGAVGQ
ncbi:MAG: hypothetical protein HKN74_03930 [Acidimicrobiia bacterium]|nr:hypothetical protein [Acidimicrobiia bacterium]MBT8216815.1 hypothetical protein [Acidimicrobiia bacterium]NNF09415.1 hypothetical protein [Acidimicrobiia bacterium]NNL69896.1 hypothetical protein [Acidimicrobiia bacterium]